MKVTVQLPNEMDKQVHPAYSMYVIRSFAMKSNRIQSSELRFHLSLGITKLTNMGSLYLS